MGSLWISIGTELNERRVGFGGMGGRWGLSGGLVAREWEFCVGCVLGLVKVPRGARYWRIVGHTAMSVHVMLEVPP